MLIILQVNDISYLFLSHLILSYLIKSDFSLSCRIWIKRQRGIFVHCATSRHRYAPFLFYFFPFTVTAILFLFLFLLLSSNSMIKLLRVTVIFPFITLPHTHTHIHTHIHTHTHTHTQDLKARYPGTNSSGLGLLRSMLRFDPAERLTVEEALAHPYLASVRSEAKEVCAAVPMSVQEEVLGEDLDHLYANVSKIKKQTDRQTDRQTDLPFSFTPSLFARHMFYFDPFLTFPYSTLSFTPIPFLPFYWILFLLHFLFSPTFTSLHFLSSYFSQFSSSHPSPNSDTLLITTSLWLY